MLGWDLSLPNLVPQYRLSLLWVGFLLVCQEECHFAGPGLMHLMLVPVNHTAVPVKAVQVLSGQMVVAGLEVRHMMIPEGRHFAGPGLIHLMLVPVNHTAVPVKAVQVLSGQT